MSEFTWRMLQQCAEREAALRRNTYAKRGMTRVREREIAMMEEIARRCAAAADLLEKGVDAVKQAILS